MANEFTCASSLVFNETEETFGLGESVDYSMTGTRFSRIRQNVGITEEVLELGDVTGATLGKCIIRNLSATNFVEVRVGTGGTKIIKILPGKTESFYFGSGVSAPYVIADTAACLIDGVIFEA